MEKRNFITSVRTPKENDNSSNGFMADDCIEDFIDKTASFKEVSFHQDDEDSDNDDPGTR